jgi:hypothetical protein
MAEGKSKTRATTVDATYVGTGRLRDRQGTRLVWARGDTHTISREDFDRLVGAGVAIVEQGEDEAPAAAGADSEPATAGEGN